LNNDEPLKDVASSDGPLKYAPKKARRPRQDQNLHGASREVDVAPPRRIPEPPEPSWRRKTQHGAFAGDVAVAELRTRLALEPDRIPEPPLPASTVPVSAWAARIIGIVVVATAGVSGYRWSALPTTPAPPQFGLASPRADPLSQESAANPRASSLDSEPPLSATSVLVPGVAADRARTATNGATSASAAQGAVPATEPRTVATLAAPPSTPAQPASSPPTSTSQPERSGKHVPASAESQPRPLEATEIALMMKNGAAFMANGNIGAARMMFRPAAEAGEPAAAFALAETYDPLMLRKLGAKGGITSDIALAHSWYEKAKNLGSTLALERLERLARISE
jgi:hypothetical protein